MVAGMGTAGNEVLNKAQGRAVVSLICGVGREDWFCFPPGFVFLLCRQRCVAARGKNGKKNLSCSSVSQAKETSAGKLPPALRKSRPTPGRPKTRIYRVGKTRQKLAFPDSRFFPIFGLFPIVASRGMADKQFRNAATLALQNPSTTFAPSRLHLSHRLPLRRVEAERARE